MKRSERAEQDRAKEIKKQKLLHQLGGQQLPYLTPKDEGFQLLWKTKYTNLILREANKIPFDLHVQMQRAFSSLLQCGCFFRDLVNIRGKDVFTAVSRVIIGNPGCTYKYLNTRLFPIPWQTILSKITYSQEEIAMSCHALKEFNNYLCSIVGNDVVRSEDSKVIGEGLENNLVQPDLANSCESEKGIEDPLTSVEEPPVQKQSRHKAVGALFNVTLLNYMDPKTMPYLKEEPYFGMGPMAVGWHHDESLVAGSPVAVYNYTSSDPGTISDKKACWRAGLKVAWDIDTPGLVLPLQPGDCYFMMDDLNMTHQHCVLVGDEPRFSSTHRVAEEGDSTLDYVFGRTEEAVSNLLKGSTLSNASLNSTEITILKKTEEIHNEVEFEWLRQYWFQGRRYAKFTDWWCKPIEKLEEDWKQLELMTLLMLKAVEDDRWSSEKRRDAIGSLLPILTERQELRQHWKNRCQSKLAKSLPADDRPMCHPYWEEGDLSMPLPFDLQSTIAHLEEIVTSTGIEEHL
ncbi:alpha-ketoglutarate-dependent dioxygenase FTO [Erpetoichthys calabaricus]|uniref:Alpha-ketoglutarate-dependent dioxygenase FTO n=1 Tax=Erpetoichthys calabaricus TaxID=27687 RepID=A0A8C4SQ50_ERPCA|nr:alpha-ketoglutarate-dependent dioxygenase FTO [Erpetoichthys calabaricus]